MYRSSPLHSTLNTNVITGLDMCQLCTEAVHCVALWTRTISQVWTWVKYVPKQKNATYCVFCHSQTWIARACHAREGPKYTISRGPLHAQPTLARFFPSTASFALSLATAETVKPQVVPPRIRRLNSMDGKRLKLVPFCANNPWCKNMTHKNAMLPFPTGVLNSTTFTLRRCKKPLVVKETQLLFN